MQKRDFIGVLFECCNIYSRVYINKDRTAYAARCPRCGKPLRVEISPDGSDSRFFSVK